LLTFLCLIMLIDVLRAEHHRRDRREDGGPPPGSSHGRTMSLVSIKSKPDEIYEHIPARTSSLRHWSITSTTPTTCSTSSNPFPRPHSRHTTNTSIDLANFSAILTSSRSSLVSGFNGHYSNSQCNTLDSRLRSPSMPSIHTNFNIDDYLSSDDDIDADSMIGGPRNLAEGEEELLFSDNGYGFLGAQLPGLFDAIPEVPTGSPPRPSSSRYLRHSHSSPLKAARRLSLDAKFSQPLVYDYGNDEDEDFEDDDYDIMTRADLALGRRGMKRLSALGTMYTSIEEENLEKIDIRTAIRLRKEAKAKKRQMTRINRVNRASRAGKIKKHHVDLDEVNHADVE
jgi:hypothetical protein